MTRMQIAWWLWLIGSILIALSWFNVVSTTIGWCGFGIGMFGSILAWGLRPPPTNPNLNSKSSTTLDQNPDP